MEKLYPARQRCKKCGKAFKETGAIKGLFCDYKCAEMPTPFKNIDSAPRTCKTEQNGKWQWKRRLRAESEVPKVLKNDPSANTYWCDHCGFLHIGHNRVEMKREKTIRVTNFNDLSTLLVKARKDWNLDQKAAADKIGIKWIRLKEIEAASPDSNINDVFKAIGFYKLKIAVVFN